MRPVTSGGFLLCPSIVALRWPRRPGRHARSPASADEKEVSRFAPAAWVEITNPRNAVAHRSESRRVLPSSPTSIGGSTRFSEGKNRGERAQAAGLSVWGTLRILLEAKAQGLTQRSAGEAGRIRQKPCRIRGSQSNGLACATIPRRHSAAMSRVTATGSRVTSCDAGSAASRCRRPGERRSPARESP